jgi:hypothetical protein
MSKKYWKVDDPLFESLPKFDRERTQELLTAIQADDLDVKDELTLQLLAMCKIILRRYLYKNPALQRQLPDLIGVLMLRTCTWVDDLSNHLVSDIQSPDYYWQIIKNAIHDFNIDDNNPCVSGNWLRKQHHKGKISPVRVKLNDDLLQTNPTKVLELEDVLLTLAETDCEREVIILRFQGYTEFEIADQLNVNRIYVHRIRVALEERYDNYLQVEQSK